MKTFGWVEKLIYALVFAALIFMIVAVGIADLQGGLP